MTYNIHPIFVHFPIALLFLYSLIKVIPVNRLFPKVSWKHVERVLLLFGVLGAGAALLTGEIAEHLVEPNHDLVEMHSLFANITTWTYGVLLVGEILAVFMSKLSRVPYVQKLCAFLTHPIISRLLAIVGFIALTVTGVLGGVMVYGTSSDPMAGFILNLLGLSI